MRTLLSICLFLTICSTLAAQRINHVQGQVLVQLSSSPDWVSPKHWAATVRGTNGQNLGLRYEKIVSRPVNIHLLSFDFTQYDEREVLAELRRNSDVVNAQFNHFVSQRAIPNDPEFGNQWQYINTGQSGGTAGADLDIELAWDYTTGGITANGDTIVACVIDGGIDADHQDIIPNLWVNRFEIPNNGIDDDNNGFVDDYRGWDTGSNSDAVYDGGGHGTPVAGIIGAKGNDGFGVAGVNWDVKLMIVQGGSGQESEVLEAYSYPLVARQRYNETNGAEGAFVVTTNASWGVDFGQPADAPLWCAFYDTLGVHGILNCGATINGNVDVDLNGDLPTGCPSDYLISVTNMNHFDQKVTGAGFGATTIDLGAFGAGTWTTALGGGFGGFGGTSGATPHVAGAVALLYSLPCSNLATLTQNDPAAAALLVKQAIYEGVDPNASLEGITTTGGRMNVHKAVLNVLTQCGGCPQPLGINTLVDSDTTARIGYEFISDSVVAGVNLRYRLAGDTLWTVIQDVSSPYLLAGLTGCSDYEYQLQTVCDTLSSDYTRTYLFSTLGCCENPENFSATVLDSTSISFGWDAVFAAQAYELQTRVAGTEPWLTNSTQNTGSLLGGLAPCTTIEYRLRVICSDTTATEYTPVQSLTTRGCGPCVDLEYCPIPEMLIVDEWISQVAIGPLFNQSEAGEDGYTDYTENGPTAEFTPGLTYPVSLAPGYADVEYLEGWAIFMDLDQDGSFDGAGERLFTAEPVMNFVNGEFTMPIEVPEGYVRLRVAMLWDVIPNGCATNNNNYGEVEDYCVTILPAPPLCAQPAPAQDSEQTNGVDAIYLSWEGTGPEVVYTLRYRPEGIADWTEIETQETSLAVTDLDTCTTYEFQLSGACLDGIPSAFSESIFLTTVCPPVCALPTVPTQIVDPENPSDSTLILSWNAGGESDEYTLRYRPLLGLPDWTEIITTDTSLTLFELDSCASYEVQLAVDCGGGSIPSGFGESMIATTSCVSSVSSVHLGLETLTIAPNPAGEWVVVSYGFATSPVRINVRVFDPLGREMMLLTERGQQRGSFTLDLAELPAGVYYVRLETELGASRVRKLVKR